MSVSIKTEHEIELMREAGHLLEKVHDGLIPYIKPGVSTKEIDRIGEQMIRDLGCIPNFLNYGGFPASFCISLNDLFFCQRKSRHLPGKSSFLPASSCPYVSTP